MTQSLEEIKRNYRSSFAQKQADIIAAWDNNELSQLQHLLHKLAGSSGSYDYSKLSQSCYDALHFIEKNKLVNRDKTTKLVNKVLQYLE